MLRSEMVLAAPGKGLHVLLGKLRRRPDIGRALLLLFTLAAVGAGLWLLHRQSFLREHTWVFIMAATVLALVAFLLFEPLLKLFSTLFMLLEAFTHIFAKSYDECRKSLGIKGGTAKDKAAAGTGKDGKSGEEAKKEEHKSSETEYHQTEEDRMAWQRAKQKARADKRYEQTKKKKKRMEEEARKEQKKERRREEPKKPASDKALEEAKSIFNVEIPFTESEIKEKRNLLIKKYHPDNPGGSEEMCKKINECYSILYMYAS